MDITIRAAMAECQPRMHFPSIVVMANIDRTDAER